MSSRPSVRCATRRRSRSPDGTTARRDPETLALHVFAPMSAGEGRPRITTVLALVASSLAAFQHCERHIGPLFVSPSRGTRFGGMAVAGHLPSSRPIERSRLEPLVQGI